MLRNLQINITMLELYYRSAVGNVSMS